MLKQRPKVLHIMRVKGESRDIVPYTEFCTERIQCLLYRKVYGCYPTVESISLLTVRAAPAPASALGPKAGNLPELGLPDVDYIQFLTLYPNALPRNDEWDIQAFNYAIY